MKLIINIEDCQILRSLPAVYPKRKDKAVRRKIRDYILKHDELAIPEDCLEEFGGDLPSGLTCLAIFAVYVAPDLK